MLYIRGVHNVIILNSCIKYFRITKCHIYILVASNILYIIITETIIYCIYNVLYTIIVKTIKISHEIQRKLFLQFDESSYRW